MAGAGQGRRIEAMKRAAQDTTHGPTVREAWETRDRAEGRAERTARQEGNCERRGRLMNRTGGSGGHREQGGRQG